MSSNEQEAALLEVVIQDQENHNKKENCVLGNCGCIMIIGNIFFILLLIIGIILGILKLQNKI